MNKHILLSIGVASAFFLSACEEDTTPPVFHLTDVQYGVVHGVIKDQTSSSITINDITKNANDTTPDATNDREQSFALTGLDMNADIFTLQAEDSFDNKSAILQLANKSKVFDDAVSMQINESGIEFIADELATVIQGLNLQALLEGDDKDEPFYSFYGYDFYASDTPSEFVIEKPSIIMTPVDTTDGTMKIDITATFPFISIGVTTALLDGVPTTSGTLTGSVILSKNIDNTIIATTEDVNMILDEVNTDITPFGFVNTAIGSFMKDQLETFFEEAADANISTLLTETFSKIPFENNDIAINGKFINFSALPTHLVSQNNTLALMMNAHAKAVTIDPTLKGALGSLYVDEALTIEDNSENHDISTVVSANMLNQLLLAAYQSGATTLEGELSGYDYVATSQAPAYIKFGNSNGNIGQFVVPRIKADLTDSNGIDTHAVATITVDIADDTFGIEDGKLNVNIDQSKVKIDILSINDAEGFGTELVEDIVNLLLPAILPDLTSSLNGLPLPDLAGYSINIIETEATDTQKAHLLLAGDMISVARTEAATAPDTSVSLAMTANDTDSDAPIVLMLSGENPTDQPLQYRYKIDEGNWSVWSRKETATLNNLTEGAHTATVCARTFEMKVDPSCAEVSFVK